MTEINSKTPPKESWASRNRRHLIAICMIVLMLAFLVPNQLTNLTRNSNPVIGKLNGEPIRRMDLRDANNRWILLKRIVVEGPRGREPLVREVLGDKLVLMLDQHPEAYMLLLDEAYEDGPGGSDMVVNKLIESGYPTPSGPTDILVMLEDGRVVGFANLRDDYALRYRTVLGDLFAIFNRYAVFESTIKPSEPLIERRLAAAVQTIYADLIDFRSEDYIGRVPSPSQEQLQHHFNLYAANAPGEITPQNEFGFGYKIPNRVKVQTIRIPIAAVRELARNTKDVTPDRDDPSLPYGWVVEAYKYYLQNPSEFIPKPDDSTTQPVFAPLATKPQPFPEVRKDLVEKLIDQQTDRTMQQIQQRIRNRMEGDYQVWKTSREMKAPTTQSSFGVPFESIEYFDAIAADVESQFKIHLSTGNYADHFYDVKELTLLPGIGQSFIRVGTAGKPQLLPFATYAVQLYAPLIDPAEAEDLSQISLEPFELSEVLEQIIEGNDHFLFRVIADEPAHVATEMGQARQRVEQDWKRAEALKLALADAQATMKSVAQSGQFVGPTTRPAFDDVKISFKDGAPLVLELEGNAGQQFLEKASTALLDVNLPNDMASFAVPLADRAFLARRDKVESDWKSEADYAQARAREAGYLTSMLLTPDFREPELAAERRRREYFDLQNIYRRNNFVPEKNDEEPSTQPSK